MGNVGALKNSHKPQEAGRLEMEPGSVMTQEKPGEGEPADAKDTQCHQCWHWCEPQTILLCDTPDTKS